MENLSDLFTEAATLMLAGMCFVFLFLGLLVLVINYVMTPLAKMFPDVVPQSKPSKKVNQLPQQSGVPPQVVAAISTAVSRYRQKNKV